MIDNRFLGPYNLPQRKSSKLTNLRNVSNSQIPENYTEWCLLENGTPASCVDIGLNHLIKNYNFDLVVSGPNLGCNFSSAYITSSGTIGGAMNAVITNNIKSVALSWAYFDGNIVVSDGLFYDVCVRSVELIENLYKNWDQKVELYSINVPLKDVVKNSKAIYTSILSTQWCSIYSGMKEVTLDDCSDVDTSGRVALEFQWAPDFTKIRDAVAKSTNAFEDAKVVEGGNISVTPLRANFEVIRDLIGEIEWTKKITQCVVLTIKDSEYIYLPLKDALKKYLPNLDLLDYLPEKSDEKFGTVIFHYGNYEQMDIDRLVTDHNYHTNAYIYRKSLIRKHYLTHAINSRVSKNPNSILKVAYPESFNINIDYAEFLDDVLDENWDLREELRAEKSWWILKPGMSERGQGIRVFKKISQLQAIFDSFNEDSTDGEAECVESNKIVTSQLRDFVVQKYVSKPLLLSSMGYRKFHIRCYVTCKGDLQVNVYNRMLALFAPKQFVTLNDNYNVEKMEDLECHLSNTCLHFESNSKLNSVHEFGSLTELTPEQKTNICEQIYEITREVFLSALNLNKLHFQPLANSLETYGLDFLVDSDLKVSILEINAFPDFRQTGDSLKGLINELFENIVSFCVRPFFDLEPIKSNNFVTVLEHSSNNW